MDERQKIENMKRLKAKGFLRFFLEMGVLKFGLPVSVISNLIMHFGKYGFDSGNLNRLLSFENVILFLVTFTLQSVFFATILWFYIGRNLSKAESLKVNWR